MESRGYISSAFLYDSFDIKKEDDSRMQKRKWYIMCICVCWCMLGIIQSFADAVERNKGNALKPGDTIAIVSPASPADAATEQSAKNILQSWGYRVVQIPTQPYGYFAGTDEERAAALNQCFKDDTVQAVLCANGGYGSARVLEKLDYPMIQKHPKLFIGFSDITALHTALGEKSNLVTIHGPMACTLNTEDSSAYTLKYFKKGLSSTKPIGPIPMPKGKLLHTIVPGKAEGRLIGGNLSIIAAAVGTPYELQGTDAILVLEDVGEDAYRVDRMMQQLWQSGLLQRVRGIVYGEFIQCGHDPGDFTTEEVLGYYAKLAGKPTIAGLPVGHGADNLFLPLGVHATIEADADDHAVVCIHEAAVK